MLFLPHSSRMQAALETQLRDRSGQLGRRELDADHQADAADLGDDRLARQLLLQGRLQRRADARRIRAELALQQVHRRQPRRDRHRVARDRRTVAARRPRHDVLLRDHRAQRHAGRDPLGREHDVGDDAGVLGREHLAGAPHAALHLVEHQEDAVAIGDRAQPAQELRRRHDVAAFAQHRLDDDRRDVVGRGHRREQLLDAGGVAVRRVIHAGQQRPEAPPVLRLARRQRQRPERAPVEAAAERDDSRPPRVVARQLDRRLDRLGARVGQERLPVMLLRARCAGPARRAARTSRRSPGSGSRCRRCGSAPPPARRSRRRSRDGSAPSTRSRRRPRRPGRRCRRRPRPCSRTRAAPSAGSSGSATARGGAGRARSSRGRAAPAARSRSRSAARPARPARRDPCDPYCVGAGAVMRTPSGSARAGSRAVCSGRRCSCPSTRCPSSRRTAARPATRRSSRPRRG